jgi:hypothetical protein
MNRSAIESMSGPELIALYHKLTGKSVARFASRADGIRRCLAALPAAEEAAKPAAAPAAPAKAPARTKAPRADRRTEHVPSGPTKPPRAGTKRAVLLARLLSGGGMSAVDIGSEFAWKPNDVRDALRLLAVQNGFCVYLGDDGLWRAAERDADEPETPRRKSK